MCNKIMVKTKAVFFDRDGVLNHSEIKNGRPYAPLHSSDFRLIENAGSAVDGVKSLGFLIIVVTNQPDVGRGIIQRTELNTMHETLQQNIAIDDIFVCDCVKDCPCYKPKPGMLLDAAAKWDIDLRKSFIVGDRWRDVGAGNNAGCKTVFIDFGYQEKMPYKPTKIVENLQDACDWIKLEYARSL